MTYLRYNIFTDNKTHEYYDRTFSFTAYENFNNLARYEEEVLQLKNVELPINTDEEMVEEVEKENIEVPIIGDEERVDELVDEELLNNNSARDEETFSSCCRGEG